MRVNLLRRVDSGVSGAPTQVKSVPKICRRRKQSPSSSKVQGVQGRLCRQAATHVNRHMIEAVIRKSERAVW